MTKQLNKNPTPKPAKGGKRVFKVERTIVPFLPKIRINNDGVLRELSDQIWDVSTRYKKHPHDFSAKFELLPDPRGKNYGHFLISEVIYHKGRLPKQHGK